MFGGKDHATVIHSIQTIDDQLQVDKNFKAMHEKIIQFIAKN